jgi:peroxiredoxin
MKPISKKEGIVVLAISHDFFFQNAAFKKHIEVEYPLLSDPNRDTIEKYVGTFDKVNKCCCCVCVRVNSFVKIGSAQYNARALV